MVRDVLLPRQFPATVTDSSIATPSSDATAASAAASALCTLALPAQGILRFNDTFSLTLEDAITFESSCEEQIQHDCANSGNSTVVKFDDPFYSSVAPQAYALATATIISYILVILIFITPRTFYVGGPGGGGNFLGLRSLVPGSGSSSVIGVGRRPLLQKIAALTVAISLTIATADTFRVAEAQYAAGLMDSKDLVEKVISSTEIRVVRVVSDTFLWLAQVQTLIRLFPRHKEKVTIKWLGFALVTCDTIFSILENFVSQATPTRPQSLQDAIPALSYLFQMSISLIYASCVIYYSLSKRRFAFWHPKMRNICLVAIISMASVLVPVVFFVLDVSQPDIATWGEYIRWVGAAAASVVVWEWVERIEALERDERKDGILGREIFDGDEMLDMGSNDNKSNSTSTYFGFGKRTSTEKNYEKSVSMMPLSNFRPRVPFQRKKANGKQNTQQNDKGKNAETDRPAANGAVVRPPQVATPISRSDTTSAASTVYQVRYQNVSSPSPAIPEESAVVGNHSRRPSAHINGQTVSTRETVDPLPQPTAQDITVQPSATDENQSVRDEGRNRQVWQSVANPFKRKRAEPPAEVAAQMTASNLRRSPAQTYHNMRDRINALRGRPGGRRREGPSPPMGVTVIPAQPRNNRLSVLGESSQGSRQQSLRPSQRNSRSSSSRRRRESLPVTVIPPPVRGGRTWSPDDLADEHEQPSSSQHRTSNEQNTPTSRGLLPTSESPSERHEQDSRNSHRNTTNRSSIRLRAPTIDSLNDRINSVSPGSAAAGSSSSEGRPRHTPPNITSNRTPESRTPRIQEEGVQEETNSGVAGAPDGAQTRDNG